MVHLCATARGVSLIVAVHSVTLWRKSPLLANSARSGAPGFVPPAARGAQPRRSSLRLLEPDTIIPQSEDSMITRRSFIIASGMTALASTRVFGANDKLRVGVIGAGHRMKGLLDAADKAGAYEIVAVSDVYGPSRDAVKERSNGLATTHLDYREVLDKNVDAVMIASPDHWHVTMAVDALKAGKDVFLEKPVTHTIEEGETLTRAVRSGKQILQCGMQQRSWTHFRDAVELIQGGSLGRVVQVRTYWWQNYQRSWVIKPVDQQALDWKLWLGTAPEQTFSDEKFAHWRWYWNFGGGALTDLFLMSGIVRTRFRRRFGIQDSTLCMKG